jgi:hypothetical protein
MAWRLHTTITVGSPNAPACWARASPLQENNGLRQHISSYSAYMLRELSQSSIQRQQFASNLLSFFMQLPGIVLYKTGSNFKVKCSWGVTPCRWISVCRRRHLNPWIWRHYLQPKRLEAVAQRHSVTSQTWILNSTVVSQIQQYTDITTANCRTVIGWQRKNHHYHPSHQLGHDSPVSASSLQRFSKSSASISSIIQHYFWQGKILVLKNIPSLLWNSKFITVYTTAHHWTPSWASQTHSKSSTLCLEDQF